MTYLPKDLPVTSEAFELFQAFPIYIKPKSKLLIPELVQKEVLEWLHSLDFTSRFEIFMINDYQITQTILQMARKKIITSQGYFLRAHKESLKSIEKLEDFDRFYFARKEAEPESKLVQAYEDLIFENLRVFERDKRFDSICFKGEFLRSFDNVLEIFTSVSDQGLFTHACKLDIPFNDWVWEMPFWFNLNSFQSLGTWIVGLMEREVWKKFFQYKEKARRKSSNAFLGQDSLLLKQTDLLEFWSSLDKPNRRKILSESRIFLHELEQSRRLKPSSEATLAYYWQFLEASKDAEFIESLFFTSLKQAEELLPLLNGLLLKELNARYSQKIANELIKAEESEKMGRKKKKKNQKTILKKHSTVCSLCSKGSSCELFLYSRQFMTQITSNVLKASLLDILPPEEVYDLKRSEYETSISVVSDTTRKCHFPSSLIKKHRCTSNSREKGVKPNEDPKNRYLAQSEITTLLDSNTDFESVADSVYEGSLKKSAKGIVEPPSIVDNKKPRNLSHEKYEQADQKGGLKIEEKKASECENFIEVKRKRSVKETAGYITNSACKPSLKGSKKIEERNKKKKETTNNRVNNNNRISERYEKIVEKNEKSEKIEKFNPKNEKIEKVEKNEKIVEKNEKIIEKNEKIIEKNEKIIEKNEKKEKILPENKIIEKKDKIIEKKEKPEAKEKTVEKPLNSIEKLEKNEKMSYMLTPTAPLTQPCTLKITKSMSQKLTLIKDPLKDPPANKDEKAKNVLLEKKLSKEISTFIDGIRPKIEETRMFRGLVLKRLRFILACLFPHFPTDLRVFGSCATGLDLPTSDLDLGLRGFERVSKFEIPNILHYLLENLVFFKWIKDCKCIPTASIPVLKLEIDPLIAFKEFTYPNPPINYLNLNDDYGFLDIKGILFKGENNFRVKVDISVENCCEYEDVGFCGTRSTELINQFLGNFKGLKSVALIVKYLFNKKGFNNSYKGGFSSYCLMIILVASLRKLGCEFSSGMGMLRFIEVYGKDFDSKKMGIDIGLPGSESFFALSNDIMDYFTIIDPITRSKNITKNVYMSEEILKEIRRWWLCIEKLREEIERQLKIGEDYKKIEDLINKSDDLLLQFLK